MTIRKEILTMMGVIVLAVLGAYFLYVLNSPFNANASIVQGMAYQSTTTQTGTWTTLVAKLLTGTTTTSTGQNIACSGSLGSVILQGTSSGATLLLYDATSTDVNKRTGNTPTTTIFLATIPVGQQTPGTYQYDSEFKNGLLAEWNGTPATSTVTWRLDGCRPQ